MLKRKGLLASAHGFTLIELLIVIVIIGILAGVLIAVIDPAAQQNRARDANVQATMNKLALSTSAYLSAYGVLPTSDRFVGSLTTGSFSDDVAPSNGGAACTASPAGTDCRFTMVNTPLPPSCDAGQIVGVEGTDSNPCQFYYLQNADGIAATEDFSLWGKSFGINNGVFRFDSNHSKIYICDNTNWSASDPAAAGVCIEI